MQYIVRPMQKQDIPQMIAIDGEAFPNQWPPPPFQRDMNSRIVRYLVAAEDSVNPYYRSEIGEQQPERGVRRLVSRINRLLGSPFSTGDGGAVKNPQNIAGYAAMWLMVDEAHLTSIAVRKSHRRGGIGELLLISMINLALQLNAQLMTLETRVSNVEAQALYVKYGFVNMGIRRRYYPDDGEDAVIMTTEKITSDAYQAKFRQLKQRYQERKSPPVDTGYLNPQPG